MNVGITGHQRLNDPVAWRWVESAMRSELDALLPPLVAVSSLAIGADQLFASLVVRLGGLIHAVIPFADYERTFSQEELDAYRRTLAKAATVEVLQTPGGAEDAYLAAGRRVVDLSDMMFAVWDGQPAEGKGGTADIVSYAVNKGVPLIYINPVNRSLTHSAQSNLEYCAFLASRMDRNRPALNALRTRIYRLGAELGRPVWAAEFAPQELSQTERNNKSIEQIQEEMQIACMRRVRDIPEFICVVDGSYGTPWNLAQLCVLELEIITATLARKPFHFFLLAPYENDTRTESLLRVVQLVRPECATIVPQSDEEILRSLRRRLSCAKKSRERSGNRGHSVVASGVVRTTTDLDVQFLDGQYVPITTDVPKEEYIRELLTRVSEDDDEPTRLVYTWMAIRHLCAAPYDDPAFRHFLPFWDQALKRWAAAAAWYGLHGHHYLGRLAAVNTLVRIRGHLHSAPATQADALSIQGTKGALASEYYSIAKTARPRSLRRLLLKRALKLVDDSLAEAPPDPSGALGIKGSILHALGKMNEGQRAYNLMVEARVAAQEDPGRIGEAEAEAGWGYFRLWLHWGFFRLPYLAKAEYFLTHGVTLLERSQHPEFIVRAMRKLGIFYAVTFRLSLARCVLERAYGLAKAKEMQGQLRQMLPILRVLRILARHRRHHDEVNPGRLPRP